MQIYLDRLAGWGVVVGRLILVVEGQAAEDARWAARQAQVAVRVHGATVAVAKGKGKKGAHTHTHTKVFAEEETSQAFVRALAAGAQDEARVFAAAARAAETETLPALRDLRAEVDAKAADAANEWGALDATLDANRRQWTALVRQLKVALVRVRLALDPNKDDAKARLANLPKDGPKDPWVANLAIQRFIHTLRLEFPKTLEALVNQQSRILVFEKVVIQLLKPIMQSYYARRLATASPKLSESLQSIISALNAIDPDKDWQIFINQHKTILVDPAAIENNYAGTVIAREVQYEGMLHSRCRFVKEGSLLRNIPGILRSKGYKPAHYVLTVSGFLHGFSDEKKDTIVHLDDYFSSSYQNKAKNPTSSNPPVLVDAGLFPLGEPEFSIFLPDSTITFKGIEGKEPKEFTIKGPTGGMFSEKLTLKGDTDDTTSFWHDLITSLATGPPPPINDPSPRSSLETNFAAAAAASVVTTTGATTTTTLKSTLPSTTTATTTFTKTAKSTAPTTTSPTESAVMFENNEEVFDSATHQFNARKQSAPALGGGELLEDDDDEEYEEEEDDDEEDLHPSVANALRGRPPPADLAALKASMTGGSSENGVSVSVADSWVADNAWDDVNPTW
ncbi:hypothetical protein HK100_011765 [Physocladia obscura]|uniref:PH domain-containing protein n=1 Tax=Physocladia obscura TaxID=109957 RepID=A0AAD5T0T2_9FUNG|nr:hypothetical protein HK100_011765 [Physocladia obscura]